MNHDSPRTDEAHVPRLLARVADRLDAANDRIGRLAETAGAAAGQLDVLTRHLTSPEASRAEAERAADLVEKVAGLEAQVAELSASITRLNRTQFKANALAETQEQRTAGAIAMLQDLLARRASDDEAAQLDAREELESIRAGARAELAAELLPSIDGIDNAITSGRALVARIGGAAARDRPGFLWRLTHPGEVPGPAPSADVAALEGWLHGLELVRERFLALLDGDGIRPIAALGEPFDPHMHVAVGARAGGAPGTVLEVVRAGYTRGETLLRFAEVIVATAVEGAAPAERALGEEAR